MRSAWFDIVSGERHGPAAAAARAGLRLLSLPYAAGMRARNWLYRKGILRTRRASVPVISVGNITVGGTGKTPIVEHLARGLAERGRRPAVVMRGYAPGRGKGSDEAAVLRANLGEGVPVIENPDRYEGVEAASKAGADVAILDDGFQHLSLARDLDIVALDATSPFGFGRLVPAGGLREGPGALARAQVVIITRADIPPKEDVARLRERVRALAPGAVVFESSYRPTRLEAFGGGEGPALAELAGAPVAVFSGIGNPRAFDAAVAGLGAEAVLSRAFPDHHPYTKHDLAAVVREARSRGARLVLTTQKDAARIAPGDWPVLRPSTSSGRSSTAAEGDEAPPLYILRAEVCLAGDEDALWRLVEESITTDLRQGYGRPP